MFSAHSFHPATRILLLVIPLALAVPFSAAELRAQDEDITIGLSAADRKVIENHLLSMEDLRKLTAVAWKVFELTKHDKDICAQVNQASEAIEDQTNRTIAARTTIAGRVRAVEADPVIRAALQASGVTSREYVVIYITNTVTAVELLARLTGQSFFEDPIKVNPANLQFLESNGEEIQRLYDSLPDPCPEPESFYFM